MTRKIVSAASAALIVVLLSASPATACSYPAASFDSVAAAARVIVVGRVVEVSDSATYIIRVGRVLRGSSPDRLHLSGLASPDRSTCDPSLEVGIRYVFGMGSIEDPLGLQEVWFKVEGHQLSAEFFQPPVDTVNELDQLLASVPDTAFPAPIAPGRLPILTISGLALLMVAGSIARQRGASRSGSVDRPR